MKVILNHLKIGLDPFLDPEFDAFLALFALPSLALLPSPRLKNCFFSACTTPATSCSRLADTALGGFLAYGGTSKFSYTFLSSL